MIDADAIIPAENYKTQVQSLLDESYAARVNNLERSIAVAQQALSISLKEGAPSLVAKSLSHLSLFAMIKGEYESSLSMAEEAIKLFSEQMDEKGIADAKYSIAAVYYKTDNYHLGLVNLIDCIGIYKKFDDYHNLSKANKALGTIYEYFGDDKKAVKTYEAAIEAAKQAHDLNLESNAYNNLSGIYIKQNNIKKATELIESAINIKAATADKRGMAFSLYGRGKINLATRKFEQAELDFKAAIAIHHQMGENVGLGMAYHKMGSLYLQMNRLDKAKKTLEKGVQFSKKNNIAMVKYKCFLLLYQLYKLEKDPVNALKYLELYHQEKDTVVNKQTLKIIENYELITQMEAVEKTAENQKAEIIKKKDIAEETARVKQEFLSTMSHEIRTPLNAVITIASLLSDRKDNKEEQHLVDTLKFSAHNLLLIINDFLDFTKLDAGKATLELGQHNIRNLLLNIKNTYKGLADEKGLGLSLSIASDVSEFYELDETKTSQIIGNLVTNAVKFTDYGNVEISIKTLNKGQDTDKLLFEVKDTGLGVDEKNLHTIFESFFQPRMITTRKAGGTGLGLAIVKKLVSLLGGTIFLNSKVGEGSNFYFELDLKRCSAPTVKVTHNADLLKGKNVLLAEDNSINAMLIRKVLTNWKMTSDLAQNGLEAVEKSKQKVFDFILMDIHMPEMDGFAATQIIHSPGNPNLSTPIFALTADVTAETNEDYSLWFNGFLHKPIEVNKIVEALTKTLQG
jgi:signal transduction histidine kinase/CheY-like chemotaxis protein